MGRELLAWEYCAILEEANTDLRADPKIYRNPYPAGDERNGVYLEAYKLAQVTLLRAERRNAARQTVIRARAA